MDAMIVGLMWGQLPSAVVLFDPLRSLKSGVILTRAVFQAKGRNLARY